MKNIFTDEFPEDINSEKELNKIKSKYPDYDDYYITSGSIKNRRKKFNEMYELYSQYADINFLSDIKKHFHERTWEMYLGYVLIKNNVVFTSKDIGPDILIDSPKGKIWIEAITCGVGEGDDRVPAMIYGGANDVPHDEMLIRIANGLHSKLDKFKKYINDGIVSKDDKLIIAINTGGFSHIVDTDMPLILKVLFAIGYYRIFSRPIDAPLNTKLEPGISRRTFVTKKNGSNVPMTFFLEKEHSIISAVMYCSKSVLNHSEPIGSDIIVVRNPIAKNELPELEFPFMGQISTTRGKILI